MRDIVTKSLCSFVVLTAACGGEDSAPARGGPGGGQGGPPATAVEAALAFRDTVEDAIVATGQIEAIQRIELTPEVEGRVVELMFREGGRVASGEPLLKIDDAELVAQVARASAERDLARQSLERTTRLVEDDAAAAADLERADAASRSAQASLDLLELQLERTTVRAPFAGVIGQRMVSIGDYVTPQRSLLQLSSVSPVRVAFQVPERYAGNLAMGQVVSFRVAAVPSRTFSARVDFVDPSVSSSDRTMTVKARANNRDGALLPGMFVQARLATTVRTTATVIPEEAISPSVSGPSVFVVDDGVAVRRLVELGVRTPGFVEIVNGVTAGELVVVGGIERLFEGAAVNPTIVERKPQVVGEG